MMKLLHSADWHLGAPLLGQGADLQDALSSIPDKIVALAKEEHCDLILLSGDLFDANPAPETLQGVQKALAAVDIPVFIAPGNHDPMGLSSPWLHAGWSKNVHIFTDGMESISIPHQNCRVYGIPFHGTDAPPLLEGFRAECDEQYAIAVMHGDPTLPNSPYNPITRKQILESGLDYLALGHIHKGDSIQVGDTLCAWPGCPMGRGYDETGEKGVLIVTLDHAKQLRFVPLGLPRFHWLKCTPQELSNVLPASQSSDRFRVDLVGESDPIHIPTLINTFSHIPNLELRDHTVLPLDIWGNAGDDSLEGVFYQLLKESDADPEIKELAARISKQILLGQEVELP